MILALAQINLDGGTQPRATLDDARCEQYAEAYRNGVMLPPVQVYYDGETYWLVDGFHRCCGATDAGLTELEAVVTQGTQADAVWASLAANKEHDAAGLYRSNDDKRRAVEKALSLRPDLSDRAIAEHVGVGHQMVSHSRTRMPLDESSSRTGRDGRTINTAGIAAANALRKRDTASQTTKAIIDPETGEDITDRAVVQTTRPFAKQGPMGPTGNRIVNAAELNAMVDEDCGFESFADHLAKATQLIRECAASWSAAKQRRAAAAVAALAELVKHY